MNQTQSKWLQIIGGFFLNAAIGVGHFFLYIPLVALVEDSGLPEELALGILALFMAALIISVEFFLIRWMLKKKRYVGIGMLAGLVVPLLTTGFCSLFLANGGLSNI